MTWMILILGVTAFVAYANGANDNFKGVATLFGSGTTDYSRALSWATVTTAAGSLTAAFFATKLIKTFSGKGLVPDPFLGEPVFLTAVIAGAGLTVFLTAQFGVPISTTHSLTGALVGAGWMAAGSDLNTAVLGKKFFTPLLASPLIAVALTVFIYPTFRWMREKMKVSRESCLCAGEREVSVTGFNFNAGRLFTTASFRFWEIFSGAKESCESQAVSVYEGHVFGLDAQKVLNLLHVLSAGAVSFARGLNDTPKIVALSIAAGTLGLNWNVGLVAIAMAVGGLFGAKRVAQTMSHKITLMNSGQGFSANLITAFLVIFASRMGVPVSTTHVSCGSIFGLGIASGEARWKVIGGIISAWILTLPAAAFCAGATYWILNYAA